ncbi:hypothetical protein B0J14DRAFT_566638 [Halenospora varia]|nr:hypothetical protein B0J14DRAFT_566638 [Halenospora varia]
MCFLALEFEDLRIERADSNPVVAFTTFELFPKLSLELRNMIWKLVPDPRILEISRCVHHDHFVCLAESSHQPSALLSTNRESRDLYLGNWLPFFPIGIYKTDPEEDRGGCMWSNYRHDPNDPSKADLPQSYLNPRIDTLYISPSSEGFITIEHASLDGLFWGFKIDKKDIRYIACDFTEWWDGLRSREEGVDSDSENEDGHEGPTGHYASDQLGTKLKKTFPKLEALDVVFGDPAWNILDFENLLKPNGTVELMEPALGYFDVEDSDQQDQYTKYKSFLEKLEKEKQVDISLLGAKRVTRGGRLTESSWFPKRPGPNPNVEEELEDEVGEEDEEESVAESDAPLMEVSDWEAEKPEEDADDDSGEKVEEQET